MTEWARNYNKDILNWRFFRALLVSLLFLAVGVVTTYFAIVYATDKASNSVTDIILSNIPVFDVDGLFVYGPVVFWVLTILYVLLFKPKSLPFALKAVSLFLVIRSVFVSVTHIGPFPTHIALGPFSPSAFFSVFTSGSDLFFSSHTGLPFLMALIFWDNKRMRWFFLAASVFFGAIVLLAHEHYTIDVLGAFFITYTIYHLATKFFKKDLAFGFSSGQVDRKAVPEAH